MGIHRGPNPINDGLVFGYDNGYNNDGEQIASGRFFKGPAHTNLAEEIDPSYTNTDTTHFKAISGQEVVDIPIIGKRTVKYVDYFNNRYASDGSVNSGTTCCPNLFHYFDGSVPVDSSSNYTYSIIYKHTGGYTHPNFLYHYQKNSSGTTLTEGGRHSTASDRRTHLGNGWYHAWGTISTQSTCTSVLLYSFLYNYGTVSHKFYVAAISLVKNTTGETYLKIPPQLMLEPLGSVSNTASLIDLKRTTNINVSNVSFDSTGQPTFDGTDDYIIVPDNDIYTFSDAEGTWEACIKPTGNAGVLEHNIMCKANYSYNTREYQFQVRYSGGVYYIYLGQQNNNTSWKPIGSTSTSNIDINRWHHVVVTSDGSGNAKMYINGTLRTSATGWHTTQANLGAPLCIGATINGTTPIQEFVGEIAVAKLYDRALSASEAKQNYNAYKNRFDI